MEIRKKAKEVYDSLKEVFKQDKTRFKPMIRILEKILNNILKNPTMDKYRIIKKQNKVLQKKLFIHNNIDKSLLKMGFAFDESENSYTYYLTEVNDLNSYLIILDGFEVEIEAYENNLGADPEKVKERKKMIDKEVYELQHEKDMIAKQMKMDREEKDQYLKDHPSYNAKGNELTFGAKIKKCSDILPPPSS